MNCLPGSYLLSLLYILERIISPVYCAVTPVSSLDMSCPCNLQTPTCDIGCCCDKECSSVEIEYSKCIPGVYGGDLSSQPSDLSCDLPWPEKHDWHAFLCVHSNNSPYLGAFSNYTTNIYVDEKEEFNEMAQTSKEKVFAFETGSATTEAGNSFVTYDVKENSVVKKNDSSELPFPREIFNGLCSYSSPIFFMKDQMSLCLQPCNKDLCTSSSILSPNYYLSSVPVVASGKANSNNEVADVEMTYWCVRDTSSFQHSGICSDTRAYADNCTGDFDVTLRGSECQNVVLKVEYEFMWNGSIIQNIKVSVYIGNVSMEEEKCSMITQHFCAKFSYLTSLNNLTSEKRSGSPGYLHGLPVLSLLVENSTDEWINKSRNTGKMFLLSEGLTSPCSLSNPISFGENVMSGCIKTLDLNDFLNCTVLRTSIYSQLKELINATHVGKTGNAVSETEGDWIKINSIEPKLHLDRDPESLPFGSCPDVPAHMIVNIFVSEAGKSKGIPQKVITGVQISYKTEFWDINCIPGEACGPYPNGTIYQNNTSANTTVNNQTAATFPLSRAEVINMLVNGTGIGEPRSKKFVITNSITFMYLPTSTPAPLKRSEDSTGACRWDSCIEYLFFPLTDQYQGERRETVVSLSLLIVFFVVGGTLVLKPWQY